MCFLLTLEVARNEKVTLSKLPELYGLLENYKHETTAADLSQFA